MPSRRANLFTPKRICDRYPMKIWQIANTGNSITVKWSEVYPHAGEDIDDIRYQIRYKVQGAANGIPGHGTWGIVTIPPGTLEYEITGLIPDTLYYVTIRCRCYPLGDWGAWKPTGGGHSWLDFVTDI